MVRVRFIGIVPMNGNGKNRITDISIKCNGEKPEKSINSEAMQTG